MSVKRLLLFFALVAICISAASINMHRSTNEMYMDIQKLERNEDREAAISGYRQLTIKFPYTPAGIKAARKIIGHGTSVAGLALQILKAGVNNTTTSEWIVLVTAFFVTTVFIGKNALPFFIFIPFILSAAGMFHLSFPIISIDSPPLNTFFDINPFIYTALTLLIIAGYICNRWEYSGKEIYKKAFIHGTLTLREQLLVREMVLEKLKVFQGYADHLENGLRTPHGRHFISEVKRLNDVLQKEIRQLSKQLSSGEKQYQEMMKYTQEAIDRFRQELVETRILFRSKAFTRKEYKKKQKAIKSNRKKSRRRLFEIKNKLDGIKTVHCTNRLQFLHRDIFSRFMNEHFIDEQGLFQKILYQEILFHPQSAKGNIVRRKLLYRKSSVVGGRLIKLEQDRSKLKESVYKERLAALTTEKKILDRELVVLAGRISEQMVTCKEQQKQIEHMIEDLSAEGFDLKSLAKIRGCFPAHVKSRSLKIRQDLKFCKGAIPRIQQVEKMYKLSQRMLLE